VVLLLLIIFISLEVGLTRRRRTGRSGIGMCCCRGGVAGIGGGIDSWNGRGRGGKSSWLSWNCVWKILVCVGYGTGCVVVEAVGGKSSKCV
jgi:hypothetical protein